VSGRRGRGRVGAPFLLDGRTLESFLAKDAANCTPSAPSFFFGSIEILSDWTGRTARHNIVDAVNQPTAVGGPARVARVHNGMQGMMQGRMHATHARESDLRLHVKREAMERSI
jgi:hypothetical protein